jgi:peptide/nickel transport system substrate-binding protein
MRPLGDLRRTFACARPIRARWPLLALLGLCALAGGGCHDENSTTAAEGATPQPVHGGTIVVASAQEPPTLNHWLAQGGMGITRILSDPLRSQWVRRDDRGKWIPELATTVPTVENGLVQQIDGGGMRIELPLVAHATWSDGHPLTCDDLAFTWSTVMDDRWAIGSRIGWSAVSDVQCPQPDRAVLVLSARHAPYLQDLLATSPLPKHALDGRDFNREWTRAIGLSSGPFVFTRWRRGVDLVYDRNPNYWNAGEDDQPYLDRIVVRFLPDAGTMKLALRMGDVDIIGLGPDTELKRELASMSDIQFTIQPGASWEQLALNTEATDLADVHVRRAIAHAIDRQALVDIVLPDQVHVLQSPLLPAQQPWYRPAFDRYVHDLGAAAAEMHSAGYVRDERDRWTRSGQPLELDIVTAAGNPIRMKSVQVLQEQLRNAGFVVDVSMARPEIMFSTIVAPGRYEIALHAFGVEADPSLSKLFACSEIPVAPGWRGKNNFRYCDPRVDELTRKADRQLDEQVRLASFVELQERIASDVPTLPLFQSPDALAWSREAHGIRPNVMGNHTWNTRDWWVSP